ncbi:MAG: STAS domain-containing protein [Brachymonas sp.]|nr:STAS domain-containing protein [Brachymonas sp.]
MAQSDKNTFLGKLARFVSNPNTDWKALDSAIPPVSAGARGGAVPGLTPEELQALRHQRRKRNRNIRVKEFAMLRQVRAGASIPGVQFDLNSGAIGSDTVPAAMPALKQAPQRSTHMAGFDVNQIDHIERQMAEQWWDNGGAAPDAVPASLTEAVPPTQMLIETEEEAAASMADDASGEVIAFDPAFFASQPVPTEREADFRPMRDSAFANGTGEQVDFSDGQAATETFVFQNPASELEMDGVLSSSGVPHTAPMAGTGAPMMEFIPVPLAADEVQSLAEAELVQGELQSGAVTFEAAVPPNYGVEDLPESLNEPAIFYAQGQLEQCEASLLELAQAEQKILTTQEGHVEPHVLLALLDFYRSTSQEEKFEVASIEMVQHYDRSAPQYRGTDLGAASRILSTMASCVNIDHVSQGNWLCPAELDLTDVMLLRSQLMENPVQVLLDWRPLELILEDAVEPLLDQFRDLASRKIDLLMWGADHLLEVCKTHIASADGKTASILALLWLLRLELVRIIHGQEAFDNEALEYCIALEESPPAWVRTRCNYIDADNAISLLDGADDDDGATGKQAPKTVDAHLKHPLQWQGVLQGSLQPLLQTIDEECGTQPRVIDCRQLDIMDYAAAAELLQWLITQEAAGRQVRFMQVSRLMAVFWRIMGITAKATVELRRD